MSIQSPLAGVSPRALAVQANTCSRACTQSDELIKRVYEAAQHKEIFAKESEQAQAHRVPSQAMQAIMRKYETYNIEECRQRIEQNIASILQEVRSAVEKNNSIMSKADTVISKIFHGSASRQTPSVPQRPRAGKRGALPLVPRKKIDSEAVEGLCEAFSKLKEIQDVLKKCVLESALEQDVSKEMAMLKELFFTEADCYFTPEDVKRLSSSTLSWMQRNEQFVACLLPQTFRALPENFYNELATLGLCVADIPRALSFLNNLPKETVRYFSPHLFQNLNLIRVLQRLPKEVLNSMSIEHVRIFPCDEIMKSDWMKTPELEERFFKEVLSQLTPEFLTLSREEMVKKLQEMRGAENPMDVDELESRFQALRDDELESRFQALRDFVPEPISGWEADHAEFLISLSPRVREHLLVEKLEAFTPRVLGHFSADFLNGLSPRLLDSMRPSEWNQFSDDVIRTLTKDPRLLNGIKKEYLDHLTSDILNELPAKALHHLTPKSFADVVDALPRVAMDIERQDVVVDRQRRDLSNHRLLQVAGMYISAIGTASAGGATIGASTGGAVGSLFGGVGSSIGGMAGSIAGAGVAATSAASALLPLAAVGAVVVQMPAMKQENWVAGMGGAALGVGVLLAFGPAAPGVLGLVTAASGGMAAMAMPGGRFVRMLPAMRTVANFTMKGMRRARAGSARGYQATHTFIRKKISPRLMKDSPSADVDMVSTGSV